MGCRGGSDGTCAECRGAFLVEVQPDPDDAQAAAKFARQRWGCQCPEELEKAIARVRQSKTGEQNP